MRKVIFLLLIVIVAIFYLLLSEDEPLRDRGNEQQVESSQQNREPRTGQSLDLGARDVNDSKESKAKTAEQTSIPNASTFQKQENESINSEVQIPYCVENEVTDDELEQISQEWEDVMRRVNELNEQVDALELGDSELELARILALYTDDESGKIESVSSYLNRYPQSEIASLVLLTECSSNPEHAYCVSLVERELANQSRYSFSHMLNLIALVIQSGERENDADRLMTESTSLPNFEEHYSSIIELMYRYYTLLGAPQNKMDRVNISVSVASVNFINFYPVIKYCKEHAAKRQLVAQSCINIGERLERFGETIIAQVFGTVFQIEAYKSLGNTEAAEAARMRKDAMNAHRTSDVFTHSASLIHYDEQVLDTWLNSIMHGTEKSAFEAVIEKAKELARDPDYNPCTTKLGTF